MFGTGKELGTVIDVPAELTSTVEFWELELTKGFGRGISSETLAVGELEWLMPISCLKIY